MKFDPPVLRALRVRHASHVHSASTASRRKFIRLPKRGKPCTEHQRHRRAGVPGEGKAQGSERSAAISKSLAPSRPLWFAGLEGVENLGADGPRPGAPGTLRCRRSRSQRFNDQRLGI
jgi:hypothetical protein